MKYPKAGDPNPSVTLGDRRRRRQEGEARRASRATSRTSSSCASRWDPDGARSSRSRTASRTGSTLVRIDPATREVTKLLREESKAWVDVIGQPEWLKDGSFLWLSDRTGYRHVYHYDASGKLVRALTAGEWAVRDLAHVDEEGGWIYFTATKDGAVGDNLYRAPLEGGEVKRLTQGRGTHSVAMERRPHVLHRHGLEPRGARPSSGSSRPTARSSRAARQGDDPGAREVSSTSSRRSRRSRRATASRSTRW